MLGGSLGARFLNRLIPELRLVFSDQELYIRHQTGKLDFEACLADYHKKSVDVFGPRLEIQAFIDDIGAQISV